MVLLKNACCWKDLEWPLLLSVNENSWNTIRIIWNNWIQNNMMLCIFPIKPSTKGSQQKRRSITYFMSLWWLVFWRNSITSWKCRQCATLFSYFLETEFHKSNRSFLWNANDWRAAETLKNKNSCLSFLVWRSK